MRTSNEMAMNDLREVERPTKQEEKMPSDTSFAPFRMLDSVRLGHWPKTTEMAPVTPNSPIQKTRTGQWVHGFATLASSKWDPPYAQSYNYSPSRDSTSLLGKESKLLDDLEREIIHRKFVHRISI